jgi:DNA-binding beta-propeller fold protein YncE
MGKFPADDDATNPPLYQPANLCLGDSLLIVSDIGGCNVSIFGLNGKAVSSFGKPGRGFGEFTRPKGIACDRTGNIYVVDAAFENIQVFNPGGDLLMSFGGADAGPGGMWLPAGVSIDYGNLDFFAPYVHEGFNLKYLVFVTNQYGPYRVSVYGYIGPDEPSSPE